MQGLGFRVHGLGYLGGFPKLCVPFWGVPRMRILIYWALYLGPFILGNYHLRVVALGDQGCPNLGARETRDKRHYTHNDIPRG